MKLRQIFLLLLVLSFSCDKNKDCELKDVVCSETPPEGELCDAYFTRWFYNEETNSCEQISYSGCGTYGFATKEKCENCQCN